MKKTKCRPSGMAVSSACATGLIYHHKRTFRAMPKPLKLDVFLERFCGFMLLVHIVASLVIVLGCFWYGVWRLVVSL